MISKFQQHKPGYAGAFIFALIVFAALFAPWLSSYQPDAQLSPSLNRFLSPSGQHWFGTDQFGRDIFTRVLYGGRISLSIGMGVVIPATLIGAILGVIAGYFGGWFDRFIMGIVDLFLAFPILFLTITCMALFGVGLFWLIAVLVLTGWMDITRLVRAEIHSLKQRAFILKAHASGLSPGKIMFRHLLPNVLAMLFAFVILRTADIILIESALSFLGFGVQPPTASWGAIINDGQNVLSTAWWITLFPGIAIALTTVSLNFIGDGLKKRYEFTA